MSHEMNSADTLLLAHTPAWHGLGKVIERSIDPTEALREVFCWEPELVKLTRADGRSVPNRALVRSDDRSLLAVVGSGYCPINNKTMVEVGAKVFGKQISSAGTTRGGKLCYLSIQIGEGKLGVDSAEYYGTVTWGHDGVNAVVGGTWANRIVCSNTFHSFLSHADGVRSNRAFRQAHSGFNSQEQVRDILVAAAQTLYAQQAVLHDQASRLFKATLNSHAWEAYRLQVAELIIGKSVEAMSAKQRQRSASIEANLEEAFHDPVNFTGPNYFSAANAATYVLSHQRSYAVDRSEALTLGVGRQLIRSAMGIALAEV